MKLGPGVSDQQTVGTNLVLTLVSEGKTLNHCFLLGMGRKTVDPGCCVPLIKRTCVLIEKRRGSSRCSWFNWLHIAPQHLVNHYTLL